MSTSRVIVLPASLAGTTPYILKNVFWLMIFGGLLTLFSTALSYMLSQGSLELGYQLTMFNAWSELFEPTVSAKTGMLVIVMTGLVCVSFMLVLGKLSIIVNCFYWAKWINHLNLDKHTITETRLSFPFSHTEESIRFDRIVAITVEQNSLENLMGVGRLHFVYIRNENFESVRAGWTIWCLDNPMRWKRLLEPLLVKGGTEQIDLGSRSTART